MQVKIMDFNYDLNLSRENRKMGVLPSVAEHKVLRETFERTLQLADTTGNHPSPSAMGRYIMDYYVTNSHISYPVPVTGTPEQITEMANCLANGSYDSLDSELLGQEMADSMRQEAAYVSAAEPVPDHVSDMFPTPPGGQSSL